MPAYPSMDQYNDAVQHPQTAFSDALLKTSKIATNGMGLPNALGGGFALTYAAASQGRKFAVRCFHKEAKGLEARYAQVSSHLKATGGPYFVGFEFQPTGVLVNGIRYPIVRMDWVEGDTLGTFLEDHHADKAKMDWLRQKFIELEGYLRSKNIAHGDIQNGNVLVKSALTLIDYDGVYVPTLPRGGGTELGHRHFQHPKRAAADFGPNMDRFSFAVLDLSLRALVAEPRLFSRHSNGENVVLTANDFLDPSTSAAFSDLKSIPSLARDSMNLASICAAPVGAIPSLEDYLAGRNIPAVSIVIRAPTLTGLGTAPGPAPYLGAFDVVDASSYDAVARQIGNRVEFVGQVLKVHIGHTRRGGRPYAFVFFNQTSRGVRVNIWNDGLDKLTDKPSHAWVGRWLSVQGLVDPPYASAKYGTSVSITITSSSQIRAISQDEARRRLRSPLGGRQSVPVSQSSSTNAEILRQLDQSKETPQSSTSRRSPASKRWQQPVQPPARPHVSRSANQAILDAIQSRSPASTTASSSNRPSTNPQRPAPKGEVPWVAIIVVGVLLFFIAKGLRVF